MRFGLKFMALITGVSGFSFTPGASPCAHAQELGSGARALGLSGATVAVGGAPFESANPAGAWNGRTLKGTFSVEQAYGLSELRYASVVVGGAILGTLSSISVESFGFETFRRTTASSAVSFAAGSGIRLGLRGTARRYAISGYAGQTSTGLSIGWTLRLSERARAGGAWRYAGATLQASERMLTQQLMAGVEAALLPQLLVTGAIVQDVGSGPDFRLGVEARLASKFDVRAGSGSFPDRLSFGCGLSIEQGQLDVGFSMHPELGPSLAVSVTIQ
jgi:hypothetical protein